MYKKCNQKGYVAFITALIIASFILALMLSFPLLSADGLRSYLALKKGSDARSIANSCAEIALLKMQRDSSYEGENLDLEEGSCEIEVQEEADSKWRIGINASVTGYTHALEIEIEMYGRSVGIISWRSI